MSDRTKTPPETPTAKATGTEHYGKPPDTGAVFTIAPDGCLASDHARGVHTPARPAALASAIPRALSEYLSVYVETREDARRMFGAHTFLGEAPLPMELLVGAADARSERTPAEPAVLPTSSIPDPLSPRYHTFTYKTPAPARPLTPPDWYDGKPKRCLGSGMPPGVQYHGEVSEDGEPKYLCRCPWCGKPFRPGVMPEHTFVPVNLEGIEPTRCDGDHGEPRCDAPCCWLDLSDSEIDEQIGDGAATHLPFVRMAQEIKARRRAGRP